MTQKDELKEAAEDLAGAFNTRLLRGASARIAELVTRAGNTETMDGSMNLDLYFRARVLEESLLKLARAIEGVRENLP